MSSGQRSESSPESNLPPRLESFTVKGLFGRNDATIELAPEGVTMLYGGNGAGKSTLLRLLRAVLAGDDAAVLEEPYASLRLVFGGGLEFDIDRETRTWEERAGPRSLRTGTLQSHGADLSNPEFRAFVREHMGRRLPDELFEEAIRRDHSRFRSLVEEWTERSRRPEQLRNGRSMTPRPAHLLTSSRMGQTTVADSPLHRWEGSRSGLSLSNRAIHQALLMRQQQDDPASGSLSLAAIASSSVLADISVELQTRLKKVLAAAQGKARELDSTFGRRVIDRLNAPPAQSANSLRELRANAESLHARLARCGLLSAEMSLPPESAVADARMDAFMQLYLADMHTKALSLLPILKRLEALKEIIDRHFTQKQLAVSAESGLCIQLTGMMREQTLPLDKLSSGEQQLLLLFYSLLFRSERGCVFMIDEPEISLKVRWQEQFVQNLFAVAKVVPMQFILATHSPQIVGNHQHLLRRVGGE